MSMHMINEAWKLELNSPIHKLVLIALAEKADNHRHARVSHHEIAKTCKLALSTVTLAINQLMHKGFICKPDSTEDIYVLTLPEE